jgi:predicted secreted Zn-dependent protease
VTDTGFRAQLECRNGALEIRVEAEFYPNTSWVKQARRSVELLRHEQGHFDLTEVYARKMKKAIREAKIGCEDDRQAEAAGKRVFDRLDQEWEKAEKQYDADTQDGTDPVGQKMALEKIARELAEQ